MPLVPLYMISDKAQFRLEDKRALYTKVNNLATIEVQLQDEDGKAYIETRPACLCRSSSGKILIKDWFDLVEQI